MRSAPWRRWKSCVSHPLLANIEAKGLETGLDGLEWMAGVKIHFVLVDFVDGSYVLKSRQYDGMTGLQSPLPRLARTSDRTLVAREGARLVLQDFGLMGTVVRTGKDYRLALKGGKLGVSLERWAKTGEVFAISRITKEGDKTARHAQFPGRFWKCWRCRATDFAAADSGTGFRKTTCANSLASWATAA